MPKKDTMEEEQIEESFARQQQQHNNKFWKFVSDQKKWKEIQDEFLSKRKEKHPE